MRVEVSNELAEIIREFGPKLYEDFDAVRDCLARLLVLFLRGTLESHPCSVCKCPAIHRSAWYLEAEERHRRCRRSG